jgi:hypothetical protein
MAKKKGSAAPSWDKIGAMIGKKMEKGMKDDACCGHWSKWMTKGNNGDGGFCGRTLFIIGLYLALSSLGLLHGIATWIIVMIGIGFALMKF